jgi:uncharacterized protein YndB with AHSA1/START domain
MSTLLHSTTVRRIIKADKAVLFAAFSKAEALKQWFSPSPDIAVEILNFDFWPGGQYRFRYAMKDGSRPILGGSFLKIEAPDRLSFTWVWEEPDLHAGIPTIVTVEFHGEGVRTNVVLTHSQIPTEEIARRHAAGWEATFDHLEEALSQHRLPSQSKRKR